ncbi:MAG: hypothetical protein E7680_01640 [Ruminococcaceae bacterium]|nr:hypothetical protein [Oscillospiraceae bacterium]
MKLISLSIENFGKLHRYDLTLNDGLNTICEENGWGKSTLAAFLKAMFYGLPKSNKHDLDENDYKRYTPWQGGVFGGNLVFSCEKGTFRIERSFGENESFALYDTATGLSSSAFSDSLGKELFGIDAEGFEQSVFLSARSVKTKDENNDSIHVKLTGIDEIHDLSNYDNAYRLLDDRAKDFKKRGGAGLIGETEAKIRTIRDELTESRGKQQQKECVERELSELLGQIAETEAEDKKLQEALLRAKQVEEIRMFKSKLEELTRQNAEIERRFANHIPTREELTSCRNQIDRMEILRAELAAIGLNQEEQAELVSLSRRFPTGAPTAETVNERLRLASALRAEQETLKTTMQEAWNDLQAAENQLSALPSLEELSQANERLTSQYAPAKSIKKTSLSLFFITALLLLPAGLITLTIGIIQEMRPLLIGGIAAIGIGGFCFLFHIFLVIRQNKAKNQAQVRLTAAMNEIARQFRLPENEDPRASIALLSARRKDAEAAHEKFAAKYHELALKQRFYEQKTADLRAYLAAFEIAEADPETGLLTLSEFARNWENLWKKQQASAEAEEQKKAELAAAAKEVDTFFSHFPCSDCATLDKDRLATMETLLTDRETLLRLIADRREDLQDRLSKIGISEVSLLDHEPDPNNLTSRQTEQKEILAGLKNNENRLTVLLARLNAETEQIPEREEELSRLETALVEQKQRYHLLVKTRDFLKQAHDDLTTRYLPATRENFAKYLALLCGKNLPKAELAADFSVSVLDGGMSRKMESYSRGWRDLLQFCVRLSLIDALYADGKETPFLLLDDPFTNLDEERLAAAKALLGELAKSRQILYLVCHGDRV